MNVLVGLGKCLEEINDGIETQFYSHSQVNRLKWLGYCLLCETVKCRVSISKHSFIWAEVHTDFVFVPKRTISNPSYMYLCSSISEEVLQGYKLFYCSMLQVILYVYSLYQIISTWSLGDLLIILTNLVLINHVDLRVEVKNPFW